VPACRRAPPLPPDAVRSLLQIAVVVAEPVVGGGSVLLSCAQPTSKAGDL